MRDYTNSEIQHIIDEWIHSERERKILHRRLIDGLTVEELAEEFTYEILPDAEAPDGEYYVMAFDVYGEEVRFDFFKAPEGNNLIRETRMIGDEEYETFYQANPKEADDADGDDEGFPRIAEGKQNPYVPTDIGDAEQGQKNEDDHPHGFHEM